nr:polysaccharide deacetylase family protein [Desulfobulbaceae bacterium]
MFSHVFRCHLFIVILLVFLLRGYSFAATENSATIFIYHKFGEDKYPTTNVALDRFEEQMQFLRDNSYQVISLADLIAYLKNKGAKPLPEKTVVITIDDGYVSTYTGAWPILKKYRYPFTVFLYVKAVDSGYRNFLTWEQVKEMRSAGVDFQPHTYSHLRLGSWSKEVDESGYREWISTDLKHGYKVFEANLGVRPRFLALPYGEYNSIIIDEARKNGMEAVFSQDPGSISSSTDPYRVPREPILGNDWSTMDHFKQVLDRVDLPVTDMYPPIIPFRDNAPDSFCATVNDINSFNSGSFGIYVSELGWKAAQVEKNRVCIKNEEALTRRTNRVAISARKKDSGSTAIHYWLLINPSLQAPPD